MKNVKQASRYALFFFERKKLFWLFGEQLLFYTLTLLLISAFAVVFRGTVANIPVSSRVLAGLVIGFGHYAALASLLSVCLSGAHIDYLRYLGFPGSQIRVLARMMAFPANLAGALVLFLILAGGLSWGVCLGLSALAFAVGEALCPVLLWSREWLAAKGRSMRRKAGRGLAAVRAFEGPYRAFLQKDIRELFKPIKVVSIILLILLGFGILAFGVMLALRLGNSWQVFGICLYLSMLLPVTMSCSMFFECEAKAYRAYYVQQLHLGGGRINAYKLPLQTIFVVCLAAIFVAFDTMLHGFVGENLLVALGIFAYYVALSASMSWWYIRRLQKGKGFNALFGLTSLVIFAIPCVPLVYALVSLLASQATTGLRAREGAGHA